MSRRGNRDYYDRYAGGWPAYVSVAERRRNAELEMEKLRKKGVKVSPVKIEGRAIASTFWGKAWCDNLESYSDFANRIGRGRTYVRNGSVVDLQIAPRAVTATVSGSSLYKIKVGIGEVAGPQWQAICADCAGGIDSLVELLQGRFSKGVMERICRQGAGLFPKPAEIQFTCSCPDYASMCKHVAAVLYGVGARLDASPELLFRLRAVDENDLVAGIGDALPLSKQAPAAGKVLEADDMAALFGLDMAEAEAPVTAAGQARAPRTRKAAAASGAVAGGAEAAVTVAGQARAPRTRKAAAASGAVAVGDAPAKNAKGASVRKAVAPATGVSRVAAVQGSARAVTAQQQAAAPGRARTKAAAPVAARNRKAVAPSNGKSASHRPARAGRPAQSPARGSATSAA